MCCFIQRMVAVFIRASGFVRLSRLKPPRIFAEQTQLRILVMCQYANMMPENRGRFLGNKANDEFLNDFNDGVESRAVWSTAFRRPFLAYAVFAKKGGLKAVLLATVSLSNLHSGRSVSWEITVHVAEGNV